MELSRDNLRDEYDTQREQFEVETANWLSEKEKVIRYNLFFVRHFDNKV